MNPWIASSALLVGGVVVVGLPYGIDVTHHTIQDARFQKDIKIAVLADVHCRSFGKHQKKIFQIIENEKPDLILIPGDLFDVDRNLEPCFTLIDGLKKYPVFFTSGNHDTYLDNIQELRQQLKQRGVHVLENQHESILVKDTTLELYGITDTGRSFTFPLEKLDEEYQTKNYRILISHRPDFVSSYEKAPCDLIVCGHVHGGQWRIPFTHQGLYAPHRGFFPKYTEGVHDLNGKTLAISRGLASGNPWIPRLYNRPEVMILDLKPMK